MFITWESIQGPTPRLAHIIFSIYLIYLWQFEFRKGFLACLRFLKLFIAFRALLEYMFGK